MLIVFELIGGGGNYLTLISAKPITNRNERKGDIKSVRRRSETGKKLIRFPILA
jgi:hypothetical protein